MLKMGRTKPNNMDKRIKMKASLYLNPDFYLVSSYNDIQKVRLGDTEELSFLFYKGFKDSVDYNGETRLNYKKEINSVFKGLFGPFLFHSSYIYKKNNKIISASLISLIKGMPILMFAVTHPDYHQKGICFMLIKQCMASLYDEGYRELYLVVSEDNKNAKKLYDKLGFEEVNKSWADILPL